MASSPTRPPNGLLDIMRSLFSFTFLLKFLLVVFASLPLYVGWRWAISIHPYTFNKIIQSTDGVRFLISGLAAVIIAILILFFLRSKETKYATKNTPWKNTLALLVVIGSFATLLLLIWFSFTNSFSITYDQNGKPIRDVTGAVLRVFDDEFSSFAIQLIGLILPVIGTWVGTVLAFYFARENFEAAQIAFAREAMPQPKLAVDAMLPIDSFAKFELPDELNERTEFEEKTLIKDIRTQMHNKAVARALFIDAKGCVKYILHRDTIDRYIADKAELNQMGRIEDSQTVLQQSLSNFLQEKSDQNRTFRELAELFRSVSRDGSLRECKRMFDNDNLLQNVVVTNTGDKTERALGLITRERLGEAIVGGA